MGDNEETPLWQYKFVTNAASSTNLDTFDCWNMPKEIDSGVYNGNEYVITENLLTVYVVIKIKNMEIREDKAALLEMQYSGQITCCDCGEYFLIVFTHPKILKLTKEDLVEEVIKTCNQLEIIMKGI